jgi:hypothetical protein
MNAAHDAAGVVDTNALKAAAAAKLQQGAVMAGHAGQVAAHGAAVGAKMGANVAGRATNYAMSEQGRAVIADGIHNGVALGTHAASGNTVGAIADGIKLGKDGIMAAQGMAHTSKKVQDPTILLINLDAQDLYRDTPMYLY